MSATQKSVQEMKDLDPSRETSGTRNSWSGSRPTVSMRTVTSRVKIPEERLPARPDRDHTVVY